MMDSKIQIDVIGVPIDLGASRRGVDMPQCNPLRRTEEAAAGDGLGLSG